MKLLVSIVAFILMLVILGPNLALSAPVTTSRGYANTPFNMNSQTLPPYYFGHDAERLYIAIQNKFGLSKGEYETSEHFAMRLSNASKTALYGSMHLSDVYAFRVDSEESNIPNNTNVSYDADHQVLHVSPTFTNERNLTFLISSQTLMKHRNTLPQMPMAYKKQ